MNIYNTQYISICNNCQIRGDSYGYKKVISYPHMNLNNIYHTQYILNQPNKPHLHSFKKKKKTQSASKKIFFCKHGAYSAFQFLPDNLLIRSCMPMAKSKGLACEQYSLVLLAQNCHSMWQYKTGGKIPSSGLSNRLIRIRNGFKSCISAFSRLVSFPCKIPTIAWNEKKNTVFIFIRLIAVIIYKEKYKVQQPQKYTSMKVIGM